MSLFGVIVHVGSSMSSGHYVAYLLLLGQWHCFDDASTPHVVAWSEVEACCAYMLIYVSTSGTAAPLAPHTPSEDDGNHPLDDHMSKDDESKDDQSESEWCDGKGGAAAPDRPLTPRR
jgi:hypothetical protein